MEETTVDVVGRCSASGALEEIGLQMEVEVHKVEDVAARKVVYSTSSRMVNGAMEQRNRGSWPTEGIAP